MRATLSSHVLIAEAVARDFTMGAAVYVVAAEKLLSSAHVRQGVD